MMNSDRIKSRIHVMLEENMKRLGLQVNKGKKLGLKNLNPGRQERRWGSIKKIV